MIPFGGGAMYMSMWNKTFMSFICYLRYIYYNYDKHIYDLIYYATFFATV